MIGEYDTMITSVTTSCTTADIPPTMPWMKQAPDLAQPVQPALDVSGAPRLEVLQRQLEQAPGDEIERIPVEPHRRAREHPPLQEAHSEPGEQEGHGQEDQRRHAA